MAVGEAFDPAGVALEDPTDFAGMPAGVELWPALGAAAPGLPAAGAVAGA